jgi:hypothetical protein
MAMPMTFGTNEFGPQIGHTQRPPAHFPIERELRFRIPGKSDEIVGSGKTIDIGSKELLFRTEQKVTSGKRLDIAISWPARLDQKCDLKLIAHGKIVRAEAGLVRASIGRYEFRTMGLHGLAI